MTDPFHSPDFVKGYAAFARHSKAYSGMMNALLEMTSVTGKHVADVGAGTGAGIEPILIRNPSHLVALEPSEAMLEQLRANYGSNPLVTIVQGSAADLGRFGRFDITLSSHVFPYMENPREALQGVMSAADEWVLSAVIEDQRTFHGTDFYNDFLTLIQRLYEEAHGTKLELIKMPKVAHPIRTVYSSVDDVVRLVRDGGFEVAETRPTFDVQTKQEFLERAYAAFPGATEDFKAYLRNVAEEVFKHCKHPEFPEGVVANQRHTLIKVVHKK